MYMKGGDKLYRYKVQSTTTLPMTPEQIHELGLSEVARITAGFEKVRQEVGFKGDLHALLRAHAHEPAVPAEEPGAANRRTITGIQKTVQAKVPQYFSRVPRTP